jgi:hypothetical protein
MTPGDFHSAFERLISKDLPPPPDPYRLAREVVDRDQRRTRWLAALSVACWLLAAAGMLLLLYGLDRLVIFIRIADWNVATGVHPASQPLTRWESQMFRGTQFIHRSIPWVAGAVVALMLATMFTVWLVFSSRRATFNRINISLIEISEQLRQMRGAAGAPPTAQPRDPPRVP